MASSSDSTTAPTPCRFCSGGPDSVIAGRACQTCSAIALKPDADAKLVTVADDRTFLVLKVESSNIMRAGWRNGILFVEFNGGGAGTYANVSAEKWLAFLEAKSKGSFLFRELRSKADEHPWLPLPVIAEADVHINRYIIRTKCSADPWRILSLDPMTPAEVEEMFKQNHGDLEITQIAIEEEARPRKPKEQ